VFSYSVCQDDCHVVIICFFCLVTQFIFKEKCADTTSSSENIMGWYSYTIAGPSTSQLNVDLFCELNFRIDFSNTNSVPNLRRSLVPSHLSHILRRTPKGRLLLRELLSLMWLSQFHQRLMRLSQFHQRLTNLRKKIRALSNPKQTAK